MKSNLIVKVANAQLVEVDRLWQTFATGNKDWADQRKVAGDRFRIAGRIEGMAMAISILAGGDDDADYAAKPDSF